jgi:hypothetical protein
MGIIEKIVEEKIREAMERGDFKDLSGKGKPVDLSEYFKTPDHLRIAYSILKNYGIVPEEVDLKKEIAQLKKELTNCSSLSKKIQLKKKLNYKSLLLNLHLEKYHR